MNEIDLRRVDLNLLVVFDVLMEERSVTRAADRLGRTQSAISHALGRLREQLGDPLLVKSGMRMLPSPFAEHLVMEVRPILANIRRVLVPPQAFEPATTTRAFRIAIPDLNNSLFPQLVACIRREAPQVDLEWASRDDGVLLALLEGRVDIALVPSAVILPDGTEHADVKPLRWASFVRKGHPAVKEWGKAAWNKWPHMAVRVGARTDSRRSPCSSACALNVAVNSVSLRFEIVPFKLRVSASISDHSSPKVLTLSRLSVRAVCSAVMLSTVWVSGFAGGSVPSASA